MAAFIEKATWWAQEGLDIYGRPAWASPVLVDSRWEDITTVYIDVGGQQATAKSRVYVSRAMKVGDMLARGVQLDLSEYPEPSIDAAEIKDFRSVRNVAGDKIEHRALL